MAYQLENMTQHCFGNNIQMCSILSVRWKPCVMLPEVYVGASWFVDVFLVLSDSTSSLRSDIFMQ